MAFANDNLSGPKSYLLTSLNGTPATDDAGWQDFPALPMSPEDRAFHWDNITAIEPDWGCVALADLQAFANGDFDPSIELTELSGLRRLQHCQPRRLHWLAARLG